MGLRRHLLDALLGLALGALLLGLFELVLAALGLGEPGARGHVMRGFDPGARYLVRHPERPGWWRTQCMARPEDELEIPPKGERRRALLLGGSNTAGLSAAIVERELEDRAPGQWEVLNLGRSGYGSGRVALLAQQALACLEPDLLVVYSGHNEFVERSFLIDLEREWSSGLLRGLAGAAACTRSFALMVELFAAGREPAQRRPEAWRHEHEKFLGIPWEDTLVQLEGYRANLERLVTAARARDVELLLCTVVYNRFAAPSVSTPPGDLGPERLAELRALRRAASEELPAFLAPLLPEREEERVHGFDWGPPGARDGELPGLRPCTGPFAVVAPGFSSAAGWRPKVPALYGALERLFAGPADAGERARLERAEARLAAALAIVPDHPRTLFELGLVGIALGRDPEGVRARLEDAARYDRAPRKGSEATNAIVRALAEARRGERVALFDADAFFAACMPGGLVGWEWMADHCHLNHGGKLVLMAELAERIAARWP